jgi:tetratricopeptide (TPR) repeat protein
LTRRRRSSIKQGIEVNPDGVGLYAHLGDTYRQMGRFAEAFEAYRRAAELGGGEDAALKSRIAVAHAMAGNRAEAERLLEEVIRLGGHREFFAVASVHAALGDKARALDRLDKSIAAHHPELTRLKVDPQFAVLRSEPRFAEMLRRLGLEPGG